MSQRNVIENIFSHIGIGPSINVSLGKNLYFPFSSFLKFKYIKLKFAASFIFEITGISLKN